MNTNEAKKTIFELLRKTAVLKNQSITAERMQLFTELLFKKVGDPKKIAGAIEEIALENKFFPDISELISRANGEDIKTDQAVIIAGEILNAARNYSELDSLNAKKHLGSLAWFAVERFGGWSSLTRLKYDELGNARAQLRQICKASLTYLNKNPNNLVTHAERQATKELKPLSQLLVGEN